MASAHPIPLSHRIGLVVPCILLIPIGLYFAWMAWIGLEAMYIIRSTPPVEAKIETISEYKNTYSGNISFSFTKDNRRYRCIAHEKLGSESLQLRLGQPIQVVPRADCNRPVVVNAVRLPGFFLMFALISAASLWGLTRILSRGY